MSSFSSHWVEGEGQGHDVRKIMDELNQNRVNMDNDRRAYDKVRLEISEIDGNLRSATEQLCSFSKKISELYESSASRSSDGNLYTVKNQVIEENCQRLETNIEKDRDELVKMKKELIVLTSEYLHSNVSFSMSWNCSQAGRERRKNKQAEVVEDLVTYKRNLEYEMDDFLLMQRSMEYAETEKRELEAKYLEHDATIQDRKAEIQNQIRTADERYEKLMRERQNPYKCPHGDELARLSQKADQLRAAVKFWDDRVSETHRILENQKQETKKLGKYSSPANKNTVISQLYRNRNRQEDSPLLTNERANECSQSTQPLPNYDHSINSSVGASNEVSNYSFNGTSKAPRLFQFKKKPLTQIPTETGESNSRTSGTSVTLPGFQSSLSLFDFKSET